MKRRTVWTLTTLLGLAVLSGCGTGEAKDILDSTQANMEEVSSASGDMAFDMGVNLTMEGASMDMGVSIKGDWKMVSDSNAFSFDGTMEIMNMTADMAVYSVEEDGRQATYIKVADQWTKELTDIPAEEGRGLAEFQDIEPFSMELAKETEEINGEEAYIINATVTGREVLDLLEKAGINMEELQEQAIFDLNADITLKIYKEELLPASVSVDFGDSLTGAAQADEGSEVTVNTCILSADITDYNNVDEIQVPQEALDAPEADPEILEEM